jgi:deoxycytidine triphosphate deaminase
MMDNEKENKRAQDRFAQTEEEAKARFEKYKSKDPFPSIKPSLLNSADISDYVAETGMIVPFYKDKLKPASYEVKLLGKVIYWDANGKRHAFDHEEGKTFTLEKNSIAFVTPEPTFRLPDYIALRFNLKITYVERGILLGTGPLVDPGFEGKLLVPLHNLTNNDYTIKGGEGFIWVEFTKISKFKQWTAGAQELNRSGKYIPFPDRKKYLRPENLIEKALQGQDSDSIRSSIPLAMMEAEESAKGASESAKTVQRRIETVEKPFSENWLSGRTRF